MAEQQNQSDNNANQSDNQSQNTDNQNNQNNQQQSSNQNQAGNQESKNQQDSGNKAGESNNQPKDKPVEIKYDLKLKDGSLLDTKAPERIAEFAKKHGLSQEAAEAVLDGQHEAVRGYKQTQESQFNDMKARWVDEVTNDKEIGGEAFAQNVEVAKRALDRFATPDFKKALESTGFGNHPELVRIFYRIGKAMKADNVILSGTQAGSRKSLEEVFYGEPKNT